MKPRDEAFLRTTAPRIATTEMVSEALNKMIADAPKNSAKREKAKRAAEAKIESARRAIQTGEIGKIPTNLERFLQIRGVNVNNFERAIKGGLLPNFLSLWSDGNKFFAGLQTANGLRVMTLRTLMGLNSVRTPGRVGLSNTDQAFII